MKYDFKTYFLFYIIIINKTYNIRLRNGVVYAYQGLKPFDILVLDSGSSF